jgi:hypothetical protein
VPSALISALAAQIREVQSLVGPGWSSDPTTDPASMLVGAQVALAEVSAAAATAFGAIAVLRPLSARTGRPNSDDNPSTADCTTTVGVGAGGGVTVTVTVGVDSGVEVCIGVDAKVGAHVDVDDAGVSDVAWTAVKPADDEHPATIIAASATGNTRPRHPMARVARAGHDPTLRSSRRKMRCGSCGFSVMPFPCQRTFVRTWLAPLVWPVTTRVRRGPWRILDARRAGLGRTAGPPTRTGRGARKRVIDGLLDAPDAGLGR